MYIYIYIYICVCVCALKRWTSISTNMENAQTKNCNKVLANFLANQGKCFVKSKFMMVVWETSMYTSGVLSPHVEETTCKGAWHWLVDKGMTYDLSSKMDPNVAASRCGD